MTLMPDQVDIGLSGVLACDQGLPADQRPRVTEIVLHFVKSSSQRIDSRSAPGGQVTGRRLRASSVRTGANFSTTSKLDEELAAGQLR
jgi:hypothetical protein